MPDPDDRVHVWRAPWPTPETPEPDGCNPDCPSWGVEDPCVHPSHTRPETPETTMRPQDVPADLVETLRLALLNWPEDSKVSIIRAGLAAVLPAHEAMVRASLSAELHERAMRYEPTRAFRRGLLAASRIVAPPVTPNEIAQAIRDGNVVVCQAPEDRIARGEQP